MIELKAPEASRRRSIAVAVALLAVGLVPYIMWRQDVLFLRPFSHILPAQFPLTDNPLERLLRFHLSDAAWFASLLILQNLLARGRLTPAVLAGYCLPFLCEIAQYAGIMPGTFDPLDLLAFLLTLLIYFLWKNSRKRKLKQPNTCSS